MSNLPLHYDGCKNLWQAVISLAVKDALGIGGFKCDELVKREAITWITVRNKGFYMACDAAGYSADKIREDFIKIYNKKRGKSRGN